MGCFKASEIPLLSAGDGIGSRKSLSPPGACIPGMMGLGTDRKTRHTDSPVCKTVISDKKNNAEKAASSGRPGTL